MLNKTTSRKFLAPSTPSSQRNPEIPFHPPLTKGERGGFEKPWRPLRPGSGHALRSSREKQSFPIRFSSVKFKYVWLGLCGGKPFECRYHQQTCGARAGLRAFG